jgi:hypothetical protein
MLDVVPICLRVDPGDIALIKFVMESYEGVAVVRTLDRRAAVIVVLAVPDSVPTARAILASLAEHVRWEEIAAPATTDEWLR